MFTKLKISNDEKKQQRINKWRKHTLIYYILHILFICMQSIFICLFVKCRKIYHNKNKLE